MTAVIPTRVPSAAHLALLRVGPLTPSRVLQLGPAVLTPPRDRR